MRRGEAVRGVEAEADRLRSEVEWLRGRLISADARQTASAHRADEAIRSLAEVTAQLESLRIAARGTATRIRLAALREAAEVNARLEDFEDPRLAGMRDRLLIALEDALERVGGELDAGAPSPPLLATAESRVAFAGGQPAGTSRRNLSVDIGPFADFSQLVEFEDAANAIGGTGDITIKRFSAGRARFDVSLSEPVDLLHELEERSDLEFSVRSQTDDKVVLDLD